MQHAKNHSIGTMESQSHQWEAQGSLRLMSLFAVATGMTAGTGAWAIRMMIGLYSAALPSVAGLTNEE